MLNEIPKDVEERMHTIGSAIRELIKDEDDQALVCAVMCTNLDVWCREHHNNSVNLANAIAQSVQFAHLFDVTQKENEDD